MTCAPCSLRRRCDAAGGVERLPVGARPGRGGALGPEQPPALGARRVLMAVMGEFNGQRPPHLSQASSPREWRPGGWWTHCTHRSRKRPRPPLEGLEGTQVGLAGPSLHGQPRSPCARSQSSSSSSPVGGGSLHDRCASRRIISRLQAGRSRQGSEYSRIHKVSSTAPQRDCILRRRIWGRPWPDGPWGGSKRMRSSARRSPR